MDPSCTSVERMPQLSLEAPVSGPVLRVVTYRLFSLVSLSSINTCSYTRLKDCSNVSFRQNTRINQEWSKLWNLIISFVMFMAWVAAEGWTTQLTKRMSHRFESSCKKNWLVRLIHFKCGKRIINVGPQPFFWPNHTWDLCFKLWKLTPWHPRNC